VLVRKLSSPLFTAVITCDPTDSPVVEIVAISDPFAAVVPIGVALSLKVTVPVAVPAPGAVAVIVAVNMTTLDGQMPID
jgi:hypothetical protein